MTMKYEYHPAEESSTVYSVTEPGKPDYHFPEGVDDKTLVEDAENGDVEAQIELGQAYIMRYLTHPAGTPEDRTKGFAWLEKAAMQGDDLAALFLGQWYFELPEEKGDAEKAVAWLLKSEEKGYLHASGLLAHCYEHGTGVPKNAAEAVRRYRQIAGEAENDRTFRLHRDEIVLAQYRLAECCFHGNGTEQDPEQAVHYYRLAAENGNPSAQYKLGRCLEKGTGVPRNEAEAAEWYRKAAEHGNTDARCELAYCYKNGIGVAKDEAEAAEWFRKAEQSFAVGAERELEELEQE